MNKNTILSIIAGCFIFGVVTLGYLSSGTAYSPREKVAQGVDGYSSYMKLLRANQITGTVSNDDVTEVMDQIKAMSTSRYKATWPLNWDFRGPDNVGGRTRCLVIDKDNPQILYTGGVSGSVFKSTNQGASWYPITNQSDNFGVVSMTQTNDGAIYYGTGENGIYITADGNESSFFNGMGLFKSTDGTTFTKVTTANAFGNIYVLTSHPTQNILFCGSQNGLRCSSDGGANWTLLRQGSCKDIKFSKNGTAIAYVGNSFWRATDVTNPSDYTQIKNLAANTRGGVAWSESDPNYCYLVLVGNASLNGTAYPGGALVGFYRSTDAGVTFTQEVGQISQFFAPFTSIGVQAQGNYNLAIGVHPRDKDRVFIGGVQLAEWSLADGPKIVGNTFNSPTNPFGVHADKHFITFDNTATDPIMYICSDGGVARTTNASLDRYRDISLNYTTTQFFGIAASTDNRVIGGTQDNNTLILSGQTFPRKNSFDLLGGDGFQCEISQYNPDIMFAENQYGGLNRSITGGSDMGSMWDNRIAASFQTANNPNANITRNFDNPLTLWEDPAVVERIKTSGVQDGDDTLVNSRLFFVMNNGIWMCTDATGSSFDPGKPKGRGSVRWFRVSERTGIHFITTSKDGNSLFATSTGGKIYRIDNLLTTNFDTAAIPGYADIAPELVTTDITGNLSAFNRTITSLAIDNANPDRAVITLGNYGNTNYIYVTNNLTSSSPTWTSIQGALPRFPIYHALISLDDPDVIVLGTEFGVWATNNGLAATPTWSENITGVNADLPLPRVPVFEVIQIKEKPWKGVKIYAGTHGMGIWESTSLTAGIKRDNTSTKPAINAYPNPANNSLTLKTEIVGAYTLNVYSITGQLITTQKGTNNGVIKLDTDTFNNGNYFVEVFGNNTKAVTKIIVQH
jgi:hypothetical protein